MRSLLLAFIAAVSLTTLSARAEPAQDPVPPLKVMTFNIQSGRHGLPAVAAIIRAQHPDVVALQEVDNGTSRSHGLDEAAELGRLAGYPHAIFFPATKMLGGKYGIALLSRFPVVDTEQHPLPVTQEMEPRTVARAVLNVDGRELSVYLTHLTNAPSNSRLRTRQAQFIARWMSHDSRPKMLMGDFNDDAQSPAVLLLSRFLKDAFARAGVGSSQTYPLPFPFFDQRLDYVLASSELKPLKTFVVRKLASDHWPVVAEFAHLGAKHVLATTASR